MSIAQLDVADVVNVQIVMSPLAAATRSFGAVLILGDSSVIDTNERLRLYNSLAGIAADFGAASPEYSAAALYFGQTPSPSTAYVGKWARVATAGVLHGGILSAAQQAMSNFTSIASGGFQITVDGVVKSLTALNFSTDTNLNGVASRIQTALAGALCTWDSTLGRFNITSPTSGAGVKATGTITLTTNPVPTDTVVIGGTTITFVATAPVGSQVLIGATPAATAANLQAFLAATTDVALLLASYSTLGNVITVTYGAVGVLGNAYTLVKTGTNIAVSGATLSGGVAASTISYGTAPVTGTDISGLLRITSGVASVPADGVTAESLATAINLLAGMSNAWYGLYVASSVAPNTAAILEAAAAIEGQASERIYGITTQDAATTLSTSTTDLASQLKALGYKRTFVQYSSTNAYAAASIFGRAFTTNFLGSNTTLTIKFKQEPGVVAENLTESQAAVLRTKNCNVFVAYNNSTNIVQEGTMVNGYFFDEIHGTDWLQNNVQTAVYNLLYTSTTKIPQTDSGINIILSTITQRLDQAVANGLVAPGVWNAAGFGAIAQGDYLSKGYYVYAPPVATQSAADRAARKAPVIQAAIKLAGAVHFVNIIINVNR